MTIIANELSYTSNANNHLLNSISIEHKIIRSDIRLTAVLTTVHCVAERTDSECRVIDRRTNHADSGDIDTAIGAEDQPSSSPHTAQCHLTVHHAV